MADKISKEARSKNMSQIKSKNTKPELLVRKFLFSKGLRYRVNDKRYLGKPDMVFPKYQTIIFVNGCFWHHHGCKNSTIPKTNTEFWVNKINGNVLRDKKIYKELMELGWKVIIVWECELVKSKRDITLNKLYHQIIDN
ncbi:DNA mismatch endonuclease, patch repair protein [Enterococcus sp. DIV0176]|uniref:very short patch repair endonuclease n=1 Tax=Enterococcus sp. DIV0176 TaxID=2774758 RepID=UPI003D301755